jgi:DNA-binding LacI/PurR family transcriptional regulator
MSEARPQATMADVARVAGVSVSTVSRALRGLASVSPEARRRVEHAARELSFAVSRSASSLVTGRTGRVAVLTPGVEAWFLGAAVSGIASVLRECELDLLVYCVTDMRERAEFFRRLPAQRNADALLVVSFALNVEERERLDALGMPVVYVSQHAPDRASVYVDDIAGARSGTRHLLNLGHRRIAFLQSQDDTAFAWSSQDRLVGYRRALEEADAPYEESLVVRGRGRRGIREAVGHLLSLPQPPTAIFVEDDQMAIEALAVLRSCGIRVPHQMSVLGFDDQGLAEPMGLSTIAQPAEEIGRAAARLAQAIISDPECDPARHVVLPTRLIPRSTTAPPPARRADHRPPTAQGPSVASADNASH